MYVNEDLIKVRSSLLYEARNRAKLNLVQGAWSSDGNILVVHRINTMFHFGYLVMGPGQPRLSRGRPAGLRAGRVPGNIYANWGFCGTLIGVQKQSFSSPTQYA